jgi:hypothetical protein
MNILYIDPGAGSLFFQALLSSLLTILVFFKRIVSYIKFKYGNQKQNNSLKSTDQLDKDEAK